MMGTLLDIAVEAPDREAGQNRIRDAVALGRRLEAALSTADRDSETMRLNAKAGRGPQAVPLDLYRLLAVSRLLSRSTGGAFDVTIGPFTIPDSGAEGRPANPVDIDAALAAVGSDRIVLHPPDRVELSNPGMSVDPGGIAKGYVLERMATVLRAGGVEKALLDLHGECLVAIGPPAGEPPFRAWIPRGRTMAGSLSLRDQALATSNARRRDERGEEKSSQIVDPRSGRIVEADRQATVVALDASIASAWSIALVVDPDGALVLLDEPRDVEALVFDEHGEHRSPRFADYAGWKPGRKNSGSVDREPGPPERGRPAATSPD